MKFRGTILTLVFGGLLSSQVFAGAQEAQRVAEVAKSASQLVSRILASRGVGSPGVPGVPTNPGVPSGGEGSGGGIVLPWVTENDAAAFPAYLQAQSQLDTAGNYGFESQLAFLNGQINVGVYKFTLACGRLATGKLALARANLLAIQFPVGLFGPFNGEVLNMLTIIQQTRSSSGCP